MRLEDLTVKIFADGADLSSMYEMSLLPHIKGFTTNPTLMRRAGITEYAAFAQAVLQVIPHHPISFEVFSDDFREMERQARLMASWSPNVYVKIPITNTRGISSCGLIHNLTEAGIKVNVTAITTMEQVCEVAGTIDRHTPCYASVFAGRIADTGRDPLLTMRGALHILKSTPNVEVIWASPREVLNVVQANEIGCHIITMTNDLIKKLPMLGYDVGAYSLDTVKMFYADAQASGFQL